MIETDPDVQGHLEQLYRSQVANRQAKLVSENHIDEYNQSIAKEIINGDLSLSARPHEIKPVRNRQEIEQSIKQQIVKRAQRQKQQLEQKLLYIRHSISTLKQQQSEHPSPYLNSSPQTKLRYGEANTARDYEIIESPEAKQQLQQRTRKLRQMKKEAKIKREVRQSQSQQQEQQKRQEELDRRKKQLADKIKQIHERMEKRELEVKEGNQKIKDIMAQQKIHQKLQKEFQMSQISLLEQRKRKLSDIRNLYKPIDAEELSQHEQKFLELKRQREEMRQREKRLNLHRVNNYEAPYQSVFYKKVKEEEGIGANTSRTINQSVEKQKAEKIRMYAELVKDNFRPEIDENKRKQLEEIRKKELQKIKQREQKAKELDERAKKKGLEYLKQLHTLPKPNPLNTTTPKPQSTPRTQYKNYITHRQKKDNNPWKDILSTSVDGGRAQKAQKIYFQSLKVQEELRRKEELARITKKKDSEQIDQAYYEMIKAKLQVLRGDDS